MGQIQDILGNKKGLEQSDAEKGADDATAQAMLGLLGELAEAIQKSGAPMSLPNNITAQRYHHSPASQFEKGARPRSITNEKDDLGL